MIANRLASTVKSVAKAHVRTFSNSTASSAKVAVCGAAGGIGQPLSMLCKLSDQVDELSCYDIVGTPGVAADLSHVSLFHLQHCLEIKLVDPFAVENLLPICLTMIDSRFLPKRK